MIARQNSIGFLTTVPVKKGAGVDCNIADCVGPAGYLSLSFLSHEKLYM